MSSANTAESPEALRAEVESLKAQLAAKKAELRLRKKQTTPAASEGSTDDDADRSSADTDESSLADQPLADDAYTWRPRFRALATIVVLMAFAPIAAFLYVVACVRETASCRDGADGARDRWEDDQESPFRPLVR
jgi:hypothetical protein